MEAKPVFTFPAGKQKIGYFSENRLVLSGAGWVIENYNEQNSELSKYKTE